MAYRNNRLKTLIKQNVPNDKIDIQTEHYGGKEEGALIQHSDVKQCFIEKKVTFRLELEVCKAI